MKKIYLMRSSRTRILRNKPTSNIHFATLILITLTILLSACGEQDARSTPEFFVPPTLSPQLSTPTPAATPTFTPEPTNEPACENDLSFLDDITIPDDTVVAPAQEIEKVWLVENSGSCNWEIDYTLRLVDGLPMGVSTILALRPTVSGKQIEISILFTAPTDAGRAFSSWQAHDPDGNPFGNEFFVQVIVDPNFEPEN